MFTIANVKLKKNFNKKSVPPKWKMKLNEKDLRNENRLQWHSRQISEITASPAPLVSIDGTTVSPFFSPFAFPFRSSLGQGFRPCATKLFRQLSFKKSQKISISFKIFETLPNCRWRRRLLFVQVSRRNLHFWIFCDFFSDIQINMETYGGNAVCFQT